MEGVEDERNQAEDEEMRAFGRRPAPEQDVDADAERNQRDQPQPGVKRAVGGHENDRGVDRDALPYQRVRGLGPDSDAIELLLHASDVGDRAPIDRDQAVTRLDAGLLAGSVR